MKQRRAQGAVRWIVICAAAAMVAVSGISVYWFNRPLLTVTRVVDGPVVESFYATGTIQPAVEYPAKTSNGGIITKLFVQKGDSVSEHQELAVVEDPQLQFQLDKATAELHQAQLRADEKTSPVLEEFDAKMQANAAMLDNARREEQRFVETSAKGGASKTDLDKAADHVKDLWSQGISIKAQRNAAKIQLQTDLTIAEALVRAAKQDCDRQTLRSPITGVVLDRPAPIGTRMAMNVNDHVMQLADVRPGKLVMRAAVDEENKPQLRDGQVVHMALYSFPGQFFNGKVAKIYDQADPDRRTFEVDVTFDAPDTKLSAGMTGELAFIIKSKERALIAPAQAIQHDDLFTVRDGRLRRIANAQVGIRSIERIELLSGVNLGDVIVISPVAGIAEGAAVRTTALDPNVAAGLNTPKTTSTFKGLH